MFASMFHDAKYFNLPTNNFIELVDVSSDEAAEIILFRYVTDALKHFPGIKPLFPSNSIFTFLRSTTN